MRDLVRGIFILLCGGVLVAFLAAWRIKHVRGDNAYNRYYRGLLYAIAFNCTLQLLALWDIPDIACLPRAYLIKRVIGLAVETLMMIALSAYLLGAINGVGWFGK